MVAMIIEMVMTVMMMMIKIVMVMVMLILAVQDYVHVMCYDYHGKWDKKTGHNAPLYPR